MGTPGTREPVPQCARIYLANLPGFMMLPYERILIEYVAGGGLGQGIVGEMVFTGSRFNTRSSTRARRSNLCIRPRQRA